MPWVDRLVTDRISWHFRWVLFPERFAFTTIRMRQGSVSRWVPICSGDTPIGNAVIQSTPSVHGISTQLFNIGRSKRLLPIDKLVSAERAGADER